MEIYWQTLEVGNIACNFKESNEPSGPITDCEGQLAGEHH
jgi:hypothetical protein